MTACGGLSRQGWNVLYFFGNSLSDGGIHRTEKVKWNPCRDRPLSALSGKYRANA
jgi:hypothetical protein